MIITPADNYLALDQWLSDKKKLLLVCDDSIRFQKKLNKKLEEIRIPFVSFSDFTPNPLYESVVKGVELIRKEECDCIMAVGGGSAIDVAKCIKKYMNMSGDGADGKWLKENAPSSVIPFLAMPTTAGTGSEATRYAVIYYKGEKQSITDEGFIPDTVLMDPEALKTLPLYQKKATMMDALCHAIESCWSVNSTDESSEYALNAIKAVIKNMDAYLENSEEGNKQMLMAAHIAGKAINISQTTAGHAMCYKITSIFGCAHGHAAVLCDRILYPWMIKNDRLCIDKRGAGHLNKMLNEIGLALGGKDAEEGAEILAGVFAKLELEIPEASGEQMEELVKGVNPVRLKNHPIPLDEETIRQLYREILR